MSGTRIKRDFYRYPKYYYTALRFMVEIYHAPKPKQVEGYEMYKTQRNYVINAFYNVYKNGKRKWRIPVQVLMPITGKDRGGLKVIVPQRFWPYRPKIKDELLTYYRRLERKNKTGRAI